MNSKRATPSKKLKAKDKEEILKAAREIWLLTYKGTPIRLTADFSSETMENTTSQQEDTGMNYSKCWGEKTEASIQNYLSKMKIKTIHC